MSFDLYPDLDPDEGEVIDVELVANDDVLVKAFVLGPGAEIDPHEHAGSTNVFHVTEGTVTVIRNGEEERIPSPGVVRNDRGVEHGARNDTDRRAVLTATMAPFPG